MKKRLLSGIRTSGVTHIGNVFGAINQWVQMQNDYESFAMLADLHALTTPSEAVNIEKKTLETAKLYLALGLNPKKTTIFVQSHVPQHAELSWILGTIARLGELERMTQFKDKSLGQESINLGLFAYPVLMAADILAYNADAVPVGEDQKQHVELTRNLAERFNSRYGQTFKIPEYISQKSSARIMGLDDSSKKMSKSAENPKNYIAVLDDETTIRDKIKSAVTDSGSEITFSEEKKPAVSNLLTIFSLASGKSVGDLEKEFTGHGYGQFKEVLSDALVAYLSPIQEKYKNISNSEIKNVLAEGAKHAQEVAGKTLGEVKKRVGLLQI